MGSNGPAAAPKAFRLPFELLWLPVLERLHILEYRGNPLEAIVIDLDLLEATIRNGVLRAALADEVKTLPRVREFDFSIPTRAAIHWDERTPRERRRLARLLGVALEKATDPDGDLTREIEQLMKQANRMSLRFR